MVFDMCSECLKKYAEYIEFKHPQINLEKSEDDCCNSPEDCSEHLLGLCSPSACRD